VQILKVRPDIGAIVVKGAVPGKAGNVLEITPAKIVGKNIGPQVAKKAAAWKAALLRTLTRQFLQFAVSVLERPVTCFEQWQQQLVDVAQGIWPGSIKSNACIVLYTFIFWPFNGKLFRPHLGKQVFAACFQDLTNWYMSI